MSYQHNSIAHVNNVKLHNDRIDQNICEALGNYSSKKSTFSWLLSLQVSILDVNDAESKESVSNDNSYLSIPFPSSVVPNLYAKPSDYQSIFNDYTKLKDQKNFSVALQFLNVLKPNSLHWQTEQQLLPSELLENLSWHKRVALNDVIPDSVDRLKEYEAVYGQTDSENNLTNDLADSLISQIHIRA